MKDMEEQIVICPPTSNKALEMKQIAKDSGVLSVNSTYFYALMARHFRATCQVALLHDQVCGYVIGYRPPEQPDTLFVWQVGVAVEFQGKGLGNKLLTALVDAARPDFLEATIAPSNKPSVNLFKSVARGFGTDHIFADHPFLGAVDLGPDEEAEHLMRIGPFESKS